MNPDLIPAVDAAGLPGPVIQGVAQFYDELTSVFSIDIVELINGCLAFKRKILSAICSTTLSRSEPTRFHIDF